MAGLLHKEHVCVITLDPSCETLSCFWNTHLMANCHHYCYPIRTAQSAFVADRYYQYWAHPSTVMQSCSAVGGCGSATLSPAVWLLVRECECELDGLCVYARERHTLKYNSVVSSKNSEREQRAETQSLCVSIPTPSYLILPGVLV